MNSLRWRYEGPAPFIAAQRDYQPVRLILDCADGLPAETRVRFVLGNFRSFRDGDRTSPPHWLLEKVTVTDGSGAEISVIETLHGPPNQFHEMVALMSQGRPHQFPLCAMRAKQALSVGSKVTVHLRGMLSPHAGVHGKIWMEVCRPGETAFVRVGESLPLRNVPGPVTRLEARATPHGDDPTRTRLIVLATDALLNPVEILSSVKIAL